MNPTDDEQLRRCDASVKRNTALVKKLGKLTDDAREALLDDIAKTNTSHVRSARRRLACCVCVF